MTTYKVYVRGHGGLASQPLPPSGHVPIDIITLGEIGCTMSDEVADSYTTTTLATKPFNGKLTSNASSTGRLNSAMPGTRSEGSSSLSLPWALRRIPP
jgi:hypothetical protein